MNGFKLPRVGEKAPEFSAPSTDGHVSFPSDYSGRWVILYIYIGDYQPCCATDILALNGAAPRFSAYDAEIAAVSPDSVAVHIAWAMSLRNLNKGKDICIGLISDRALDIAKGYGVNNTEEDISKAERAVFIIDRASTVQAVHKLSASSGINVTELERELLALQSAACQCAITPSGWTPGEEVIEYPPQTLKSASGNVSERTMNGCSCVDWYICHRADSGVRRLNEPLPHGTEG